VSITFSRRCLIIWLAGCAPICLSVAIFAEEANWRIDPEHFSIAFEAEHIGYQQQLGFFLEGTGNFQFDSETDVLSSGRVEIVSGSLFSNHDDRDNHLKGKDFLNAEQYTLIVFEATEYRPVNGTLRGDLTILGQTHAIDLKVKVNKQAIYPFGHRRETLGVSASASIRRSRWGMDYGVSGNMVGDEVKLRFEFEAVRQ
tara:strand:+ start:3322 stop:3918 length:597 start_codon:yes stop_codon:yes gene_type:complete